MIFKNAMILSDGKTKIADIQTDGQKIVKIGENLSGEGYDLKGAFVTGGAVDPHAHFRQPGYEAKETIKTGSLSAAKGGVFTAFAMPNLNPVPDSEENLQKEIELIKKDAEITVLPFGAVTKGQQGRQLADIASIADKVVAFSDDGKPVRTSQMMRLALEYSKAYDLPVLCHCEDMDLTNGGCVNEGYNATVYGLKGINRASEEVAVAREIIIAANLGAKVHICHVSTAGSVEIIRAAKKLGVKVTAETCPHYISLTDDCVAGFNTMAKVNPPLREAKDVEAVRAALADGTIDCLATDHAPHAHWDKECQFDTAAFGISGLETAFAVNYTYLVKTGVLNLPKLSALMTKNPCSVLKLPDKGIAVGEKADLTVVDLNKAWTVNPSKFASKGKNTPFAGKELFGAVEMTFVDGDKKYARDGE